MRTILMTVLSLVFMFPLFGGGEQDPDEKSNTYSEPSEIDRTGNFILNPGPPPYGAEVEFSTDFSKTTIPYNTILSGGPPKDGIPALDSPEFISVSETRLEADEPVLLLKTETAAKIYPLRILMWHEIVNDEAGGIPVAVTYCPLCNTGIAFRRETEKGLLDFGTTGRLRYSNLIMYDRQTETWWQQATGEAVVGELAGEELGMLPVLMISWKDAAGENPGALVLSPETGFDRPYGRNPYRGYDTSEKPFLYSGPPTPGDFPPLERVLVIHDGEREFSVPYSRLEEDGIWTSEPGIVVFYMKGTASALDAESVASGRSVGSGTAFRTGTGEYDLEFYLDDGTIRDRNTGSTWNISGNALSGILEGTELEPVTAVNHFWFSYNAFFSQD